MATPELAFYLQVASNAQATFSNTQTNDVLIYQDSNSQRILLGNSAGIPTSTLTIASNMIQVNGNLSFDHSINLKSLEITGANSQMTFLTTSSVPGFSNVLTGIDMTIDSNLSTYQYRYVAGLSATELMRLTGDGKLTVNGNITLSNSKLRLQDPSYSMMWQNDNTFTYLSRTNFADPNGAGASQRVIMVNNRTGYVGIGGYSNYAVSWPLTVWGSSNTGNINYNYINITTSANGTGSGRNGLGWGLYSDKTILCLEVDVYSDRRIKCDISYLNSAETLDNINRLKPCTFSYIDRNKSTAQNTGFIAQEVEEVFPRTVKKITDYIPNIFKFGKIFVLDTLKTYVIILEDINLDIKQGDNLQIAVDNHVNCEVLDIRCYNSTSHITVKTESILNIPSDNEVFVIGKEVDDYRVLSYESIMALSISALQEISKSVDLLESEINSLI